MSVKCLYIVGRCHRSPHGAGTASPPPAHCCGGVPALALGVLGSSYPAVSYRSFPALGSVLPLPSLFRAALQRCQDSACQLLDGTCGGTSSSTDATCPSSASSALSCPLCFPGHGLSLLFFGFPAQFGGSASMGRVFHWEDSLCQLPMQQLWNTPRVCGAGALPAWHWRSPGQALLWHRVGSGPRRHALNGNPSPCPHPAWE